MFLLVHTSGEDHTFIISKIIKKRLDHLLLFIATLVFRVSSRQVNGIISGPHFQVDISCGVDTGRTSHFFCSGLAYTYFKRRKKRYKICKIFRLSLTPIVDKSTTKPYFQRTNLQYVIKKSVFILILFWGKIRK